MAEGGDWSSDGSSERALDLAGDWDEAKLRQRMAEETEEAVQEAQPGVVVGIDGSAVELWGGCEESNPPFTVKL